MKDLKFIVTSPDFDGCFLKSLFGVCSFRSINN